MQLSLICTCILICTFKSGQCGFFWKQKFHKEGLVSEVCRWWSSLSKKNASILCRAMPNWEAKGRRHFCPVYAPIFSRHNGGANFASKIEHYGYIVVAKTLTKIFAAEWFQRHLATRRSQRETTPAKKVNFSIFCDRNTFIFVPGCQFNCILPWTNQWSSHS